jgi:hypothetical protein
MLHSLPVAAALRHGVDFLCLALAVKTIIINVDSKWSGRDGTVFPPDAQFVLLDTAKAAQLWHNKLPEETIIERPGKPLPDIKELNEKIPQDTWEPGLDGKPRRPWTIQYAAYLFDPKDASIYTFVNSTAGAKIAVDRLNERVRLMRALRGANVFAIVQLDSKIMKTAYGPKPRPDFKIIDWRIIGGDGEQVAATSPTPIAPPTSTAAVVEQTDPQVGTPVKPVTLTEEIDDEIPEFDNDVPDFGDR